MSHQNMLEIISVDESYALEGAQRATTVFVFEGRRYTAEGFVLDGKAVVGTLVVHVEPGETRKLRRRGPAWHAAAEALVVEHENYPRRLSALHAASEQGLTNI